MKTKGTVTLALVAMSSTSALPSTRPAGVSIPLVKRGTLLSGNGTTNSHVVNMRIMDLHVQATSAKYQQGMRNWQNNQEEPDSWAIDSEDCLDTEELVGTTQSLTGTTRDLAGKSLALSEPDHFNASLLPDAAPLNKHALRSHARLRRRTKRQSEALINEQNDLLWAGYVSIGSNQQPFLIDMDTGSADFWVPNIRCTSKACDPHNKYDTTASMSSQEIPGKTFKITYGDGSTASGPVYTDTVNMAGYTADNQYFSAVTTATDTFGTDIEDGILGLAFQSISELNQPPFFQSLINQQKVADPTFSFRLAKTGSELYLGGTNPDKYTGPIEWHPITSKSYWLVKGAPLVNGKNITADSNKTYNMAIDSGTTVILAPTADAKAFWKTVPGAAPYTGDSSYWTYPCRNPPQISFTFGNRKWPIAPADFNLGQVSSGSASCIGAVVGKDVGVSAWILGDAFMKNVYSAFDMGQKRVGFATPK